MDRQHKIDRSDIVIVGNGIAGITTAVEARRLAPEASIAIITEQCHPPINTPALKQFAVGKLAQEQLLVYPAGNEYAQRIHVINTRVESINTESKYVCITGGYGFGYSSLLLATGSTPNGLPTHLPGRDFDGVLTLHNLQDYLNLRRRLDEVDSAVVIGGGAHAIETVVSLLHYRIEVHWLIRSEIFLPQMLDQFASEMVLKNIHNAGAKVYIGTEVTGIVGRVGSVAGVVTNQGKMIPCQLVLACTGTSPVTTLAERCDMPMMHNRGILVDNQCRTSVRDIYAAGDVAASKNPQTGSYETHAQWYAAVLQGGRAAAMMTGHDELASDSPGVPWHATHLGDLFMLTVGNPLKKIDGTTTLTNSGKKKYCRMSIIEDRLVGYLSLGSIQPDSLAIKRIIDEGLSIGDVKKALLKGDFDARKYFSQQRSRTVQEMVTSGKLPVVHPIQHPLPMPGRYPLEVLPSISTQMIDNTASEEVGRKTEPLVGQIPPDQMLSHQLATHEWQEEAKLTTDKLAIQNQLTVYEWREEAKITTDKLAIHNQPTVHEWQEETKPAVRTSAKKVVEAILVPLPSRAVTRTLWEYCEKIPTGTTTPEKVTRDKEIEHDNFLL